MSELRECLENPSSYRLMSALKNIDSALQTLELTSIELRKFGEYFDDLGDEFEQRADLLEIQ